TPTGGRVQITLTARQAGLNLLVDDSGPGIPPVDRQAMFERFRRGVVQDTLGCGLGLSIVAAVVEIHRGKIILQESPLGGLRAEVWLPGAG
ncbi:MAG: two-component sensor histidine kinase, partial [Magnetococcales bacterium]|nr:two-component sensor histidine kinase [Magnetococcales bacterium]